MSHNSKKTILYIYPGAKSTFVAKDIRLLSDKYSVKEYSFNTDNKKLILWEFIKQKLFIFKNLFSADVFLIKFGGYWSLIPVLFAKIYGKKAIIITGGTDCVSFPEINYGNFQNSILSVFTKLSFKWADRIIALHPSMMLSEYSYFDAINKSQGLEAHISNLKTPSTVAFNGYDSQFWHKTKEKRKGVFLTVASGLSEERRQILKGIDIILKIAPLFPDNKFIIIGADDVTYEVPKNVILMPKANAETLREQYSKAQFYLQLSISEGFPNSLCEAMLCDCVPIVSNVASMPFIIEESGFILKKKDVGMLESLIINALNSDTELLGKKARNRIANNFTEQNREKSLIEAIELSINQQT